MNLFNYITISFVRQIPPFIYTNKKNALEGYEVDVISELAKFLNFTYQMIDCQMDWGQLLDNGSWDGLVGMIQNKVISIQIKIDFTCTIFQQVDLGLGELSITNDRMNAISFTYPHIVSGVTFTAPLPGLTGYSTSLFTPYTDRVWVVLFLAIVTQIGANIWLRRMRNSSAMFENFNWSLIMVLFNQPIASYRKLLSQSMRFLIIGWLLSGFVLRTSYGGCLYSLMARHKESDTIETIHELAIAQERGRVQVITPDGGIYAFLFKVKFSYLDN